MDAAAAAPVAANPLLTARTCRSNTHDRDRGIARARLPHDGPTSAIFGSLRRFTLTFRTGTTILWAHQAPRPRFLSNDSCATLTYTHFNSRCFKKPSRPLYRMNLQNIWTLPHENLIGLKVIRNKLLQFELQNVEFFTNILYLNFQKHMLFVTTLMSIFFRIWAES